MYILIKGYFINVSINNNPKLNIIIIYIRYNHYIWLFYLAPFIISINPRIPEIYPIAHSKAPKAICIQTFQWLFGSPQVYMYIIGGIKNAGKTTQKHPMSDIYPTTFWYTLDNNVVKNKVIDVKIILNFLVGK